MLGSKMIPTGAPSDDGGVAVRYIAKGDDNCSSGGNANPQWGQANEEVNEGGWTNTSGVLLNVPVAGLYKASINIDWGTNILGTFRLFRFIGSAIYLDHSIGDLELGDNPSGNQRVSQSGWVLCRLAQAEQLNITVRQDSGSVLTFIWNLDLERIGD